MNSSLVLVIDLFSLFDIAEMMKFLTFCWLLRMSDDISAFCMKEQ